jgi:uncharacterized protein (DUF924 family)
MPNPSLVLTFWFSESLPADWFKKSDQFDARVRTSLEPLYEQAVDGALQDWRQTAEGCLALCILLDQVPRNIFRGSPKSFATDKVALEITNEALKKGFEVSLSQNQRTFLFLPLEHSENLADQKRSVKLFNQFGNESTQDFAVRHLKIIQKFGRFPHRNDILHRQSTEEEIEFLKQPGSGF